MNNPDQTECVLLLAEHLDVFLQVCDVFVAKQRGAADRTLTELQAFDRGGAEGTSGVEVRF